jgi:hypothetical protein
MISNVCSQLLLSKFLLNEHLEGRNLSELMTENQIDFESRDISNFSFEVLDNLLLNEFVTVESEDSLLRDILKLGPGYRDLVRHIHIVNLSEDGLFLLSESFDIPSESVWECAVGGITRSPPPRFDSQIISEFPEIFTEFRGTQFSLLWRGSRDGFKANDFHVRCDGHANTLTVILDTKGNIFGGFTPVKWESGNSHKADDSLKSFLFTLKNPHNIPARRFPLKAEMKHSAIYCLSGYGPLFGETGGGICVYDNCNAGSQSNTGFDSYNNDTGQAGDEFFTGSLYFQVKEIEVFEITD